MRLDPGESRLRTLENDFGQSHQRTTINATAMPMETPRFAAIQSRHVGGRFAAGGLVTTLEYHRERRTATR